MFGNGRNVGANHGSQFAYTVFMFGKGFDYKEAGRMRHRLDDSRFGLKTVLCFSIHLAP